MPKIIDIIHLAACVLHTPSPRNCSGAHTPTPTPNHNTSEQPCNNVPHNTQHCNPPSLPAKRFNMQPNPLQIHTMLSPLWVPITQQCHTLTLGIVFMISWQHICQIPIQAEHHFGVCPSSGSTHYTLLCWSSHSRTATSWSQSIHSNSSFGLTLQIASLCQRALPKTSPSCQIPQPCRTPHCHLHLEDTTQTTIQSTHQHSLDKKIMPCGERPHTPAYKRDEASHTSPLTHSGIDPSRATLCMHHTSPVCKTHPHTPIIRHLQA
jgi:hypothetical protein